VFLRNLLQLHAGIREDLRETLSREVHAALTVTIYTYSADFERAFVYTMLRRK
jgi:hypothetical protein